MDPQSYHHLGLGAGPPANGLFIHDFVKIGLPFDAVVGAFTYYVSSELVAELVVDAWRTETVELGRALELAIAEPDEPLLDVRFGRHRSRSDALVVPVSWRPTGEWWIPSLEADLEVAAFGAERTHLHILGLSQLPPGTTPCTERASLEHRLTVAFVRHTLGLLADVVVDRVVSPSVGA